MARRGKASRTGPRLDTGGAKTPLDLARALLRYGRMADPCRAYDRMHAEWPPDVARILDKVLWAEVKIAHRTVDDVAAELHALHLKAAAQVATVRALMASRSRTAKGAVEETMRRPGKSRRR